MFYSPASWMPDIITFNLIYMEEEKCFYRLTVKAKNMSV